MDIFFKNMYVKIRILPSYFANSKTQTIKHCNEMIEWTVFMSTSQFDSYLKQQYISHITIYAADEDIHNLKFVEYVFCRG